MILSGTIIGHRRNDWKTDNVKKVRGKEFINVVHMLICLRVRSVSKDFNNIVYVI